MSTPRVAQANPHAHTSPNVPQRKVESLFFRSAATSGGDSRDGRGVEAGESLAFTAAPAGAHDMSGEGC